MEDFNNEMILPIVALITVSSIFYYSTFAKPLYPNRSSRNSKSNISEIPSAPFFGTLYKLIVHLSSGRADLYFTEMCRDYGPVVRGQILGDRFIAISDHVLMKKILNSPACPRTPIFQNNFMGINSFLLNILPTEDTWRKHRKGLQPAFGPIHLRESVTVSVKTVNRLLDVWEELYKRGESIRNLTHDFGLLTGDVIAQVAFSADFGLIQSLLQSQTPEIIKIFDKINDTVIQRIVYRGAQFLWPSLGISVPQLSHTVNKLEQIISNIVNDKKQKLSDAHLKIDKENPQLGADLLERLLSVRSDTDQTVPWFSDEEIYGEVHGFFAAGQDTTATTLTWIMYQLTKNPRIFRKLEMEVETINNELTHESLNSYKYLDAVIKETLRIHSPAFSLSREASCDVELSTSDGELVFLRKGEVLHLNLSALHTDEKIWGADAKDFVPERWLKEGFVAKDGTFMPFVILNLVHVGDGQMNCIGQKLAMIELKVAMILILRRFRFEAIKDQAIRPVLGITLGLRDGFYVIISPK
ncbi:hypothetical protein HK098_003034 [Nowakowskiella sp. JEL0407]|nr:hypothetical protein HK098_003034 [Nowakowskiella sp. JEL0407]